MRLLRRRRRRPEHRRRITAGQPDCLRHPALLRPLLQAACQAKRKDELAAHRRGIRAIRRSPKGKLRAARVKASRIAFRRGWGRAEGLKAPSRKRAKSRLLHSSRNLPPRPRPRKRISLIDIRPEPVRRILTHRQAANRTRRKPARRRKHGPSENPTIEISRNRPNPFIRQRRRRSVRQPRIPSRRRLQRPRAAMPEGKAVGVHRAEAICFPPQRPRQSRAATAAAAGRWKSCCRRWQPAARVWQIRLLCVGFRYRR